MMFYGVYLPKNYVKLFLMIIVFKFIFIIIQSYCIIKKSHIRKLNYLPYEVYRPKIFCIILTKPENLMTKARTIHETWAKDCDKHVFIAKFMSYGLINESYEVIRPLPVLQPSYLYKESYSNLTYKVFRTFQDIYLRYSLYYDWFLKTDDDTFVFIDNLRLLVSKYKSNEAITFGYDFKKEIKGIAYHSGGAGYVLSREALKRLSEHLIHNFTSCKNTGIEDLDVARCLKYLNVSMVGSVDDLGRERFHPFSVYQHLYSNLPKWLYAYAKNPIKIGPGCCSNETISFHYMSQNKIKKLYSFWNMLKQNITMFNNFTQMLYSFELT